MKWKYKMEIEAQKFTLKSLLLVDRSGRDAEESGSRGELVVVRPSLVEEDRVIAVVDDIE